MDHYHQTTCLARRSQKPEQAPPSPVYLPYPLPVAATPTADSPGYILEFDPNGDPKEDEEEYPKEEPTDYPADFTVVGLPAGDHVPSEEVIEPLPQIPSPPLPIPSPPPDSLTHIEIFKSCLPLRKRLRFATPTPSQEVEESSAAGAARQNEPTIARDDPYSLVKEELYGFFDRVDVAPRRLMSKEDRPVHRHLAVMVEREARMAREAWELSMDASDNARSDVMSLCTTLVAQHAMVLDLQAADRRRQGAIKELLVADHKRQVQLTKALRLLKGLHTQMIEFQMHHGPAKETTTSVTNAQLQAMIDQGVTTALAARDANRNGDDSHTSGTGRPVQVARECTYPDILKCQPLNFKGTEGVVRLNLEAAHAMPWRTLKKMMTDKYCPRGEIKKLESEIWNLKVKGTDVVAYSQRFQELALMCDQMFSEEIDKVERYVDGLPDTIHNSVMATKPKTMQDAIEFATELMNKKINTWAERQANNKRKSDDTTRNNHQQSNKRQNTGRAYAAGNGDKRAYEGPGPRNPPIVNTRANQRGNVCFECGAQGHFKRKCPKLKNNNNRGNQVGNAKTQTKVYAVGKAGANPDNNVVM
nr:hypothetical protein [Tanacetum cinerariifolium]